MVGTENHKIAVMCFKKASAQGHAEAQYHLGNMYRLGKGTGQDYQDALKWFEIASEQGQPDATAFIGLMYFHGTGVPQDYTELFKWLEKAAEMEQDEGMIKKIKSIILIICSQKHELCKYYRKALILIENWGEI